jgi:SAM-dependent methyltransferase
VVRFDLPRLGDVRGLRGVHLQCHIGTDTVSLARLGARMTGLDFSPAALAEARRLAALAGVDVDFVEADVHDASTVLAAGAFDLVYTGIGAICWIPSIASWANIVATLLKPSGRLFMREGHPMLWTLDERRTDAVVVAYPYFEAGGAVLDDDDGTYVQTDATFSHNVAWSWNHGLGETVTALLAAGMRITMLEEHDSVPWDALPGQMEDIGGGEYRLRDRPWRVPHTFTLQAVRER